MSSFYSPTGFSSIFFSYLQSFINSTTNKIHFNPQHPQKRKNFEIGKRTVNIFPSPEWRPSSRRLCLNACRIPIFRTEPPVLILYGEKMELPLISTMSNRHDSITSFCSCREFYCCPCYGTRTVNFPARKMRRGIRFNRVGRVHKRCVKASAGRSSEGIEARESFVGGPAMDVTTSDRSFSDDASDFAFWEKIGAVVRLSYGIGMVSILFYHYILLYLFYYDLL